MQKERSLIHVVVDITWLKYGKKDGNKSKKIIFAFVWFRLRTCWVTDKCNTDCSMLHGCLNITYVTILIGLQLALVSSWELVRSNVRSFSIVLVYLLSHKLLVLNCLYKLQYVSRDIVLKQPGLLLFCFMCFCHFQEKKVGNYIEKKYS